MIVPQKGEAQPGSFDLFCVKRGVRLLTGSEVGGTHFSSVEKTEMNTGAVDPEVFQKIRYARWRNVSSAPEGEALGDRHGNQSVILKHVDVRTPANPPV
jgi:hypothetical protein